MTLQLDPEKHRIETQTATVGEQVTVPYHPLGISIRPLSPFDQTVMVSYLIPNDAEQRASGPGEGNEFIIREHVLDRGETENVELPYYATGTSVYVPVDDDSTFVYFLA